MGEHVNITKAKKSSYRYFMRTYKDGGNMGDTSNYNHYNTDFVYDHDLTCLDEDDNIRKEANFQVFHVSKSEFFSARDADFEAESGAATWNPMINLMLLLGSTML